VTDREKIDLFIKQRGVTRCPPPNTCHRRPLGKPALQVDTPIQEMKRTPEQSLAAAKILLMFADLQRPAHQRGDSYQLRQQAIRFFFSSESDLDAWCDDAGLLPERVRQKARETFEG